MGPLCVGESTCKSRTISNRKPLGQHFLKQEEQESPHLHRVGELVSNIPRGGPWTSLSLSGELRRRESRRSSPSTRRRCLHTFGRMIVGMARDWIRSRSMLPGRRWQWLWSPTSSNDVRLKFDRPKQAPGKATSTIDTSSTITTSASIGLSGSRP